MNLKERNMVYRVYKALDTVPGAYIGGGTMSTTVAGVASFGADIQEVRKHCTRALLALCDGAISAAERDERYEHAMGAAEDYIAKRKARDWSARGHSLT